MAELWRQPEKCRKSAGLAVGVAPPRFSALFWPPFGFFSLRYPAARAVCGDGAAVRETDSLQFALYFQPGSEAAGREDKVLQRRGEQRLRLRHENHVILQIDIVCERWFLYQGI